MTGRDLRCLVAVTILAPALTTMVMAAEPFKLGVQEKGYLQQQPLDGSASYPAPQMIPQTPTAGTSAPLRGGATAAPPRPLQAGVSVQLPPQFLGAWLVRGQRVKVEAQPEFQAGAEQAFQVGTSNVWQISGSPSSGYTMGSDTGIKTQLVVDKVQDNTAFIRYQHAIGKTMAQEAIVMSLQPGGAQFNGLERVSIVKEGLAQPRARVTYQLTGTRQR